MNDASLGLSGAEILLLEMIGKLMIAWPRVELSTLALCVRITLEGLKAINNQATDLPSPTNQNL